MSGACGRAARDGRGTRRQSSGQGQIQGYRTDAKKSLTKYLEARTIQLDSDLHSLAPALPSARDTTTVGECPSRLTLAHE